MMIEVINEQPTGPKTVTYKKIGHNECFRFTGSDDVYMKLFAGHDSYALSLNDGAASLVSVFDDNALVVRYDVDLIIKLKGDKQ